MSRVALITGATSGIGAAYARILGKKGWDLIITGRREEKIRALAEELESACKISIKVVIVDFNNKIQFMEFLENVVKKSNVEFLVNSVGFSNHTNFFDSNYYNNHMMIDAHISAMTEIIHLVVPYMKEIKKGTIVNVSSLAGFLSSLSDPFYSASKSFINTYSESISLILKKYNIVVQSLCPGYTRTDFHKNMKLEEKALKNKGLKRWMRPEDVAFYSYNNLKSNKVIVIPGISNKIVYHITKLMPKKFYYCMAGKKRALDEK